MTFILAAPLNEAEHNLYARFHDLLIKYERPQRLPGDEYIDPAGAEIVVFGVGRIGLSVYKELESRYGKQVMGIDSDENRVNYLESAGMNVITGDASDSDFWARTRAHGVVRLVLLTMSDHQANMFAAKQLARIDFRGRVAATARYEDEITELKQIGVKDVYHLFEEAGAGFADHVCRQIEQKT
jgi:Trk K+ transport system NAD-binding subunit